MTPDQLLRRSMLVSKDEDIRRDWPEHTGEQFIYSMSKIVAKFESLAQEADAGNGDPLERARTWRFTGLAYFDLGNAENQPDLLNALSAYKKSIALSDLVNDPVETMKINYSMGHVLFRLSDENNLSQLKLAEKHHVIALQKAKQALPSAIETAQEALEKTRKTISLLEKGHELTKTIDRLQALPSENWAIDLYQQLKDKHESEKAEGKLSENRATGLDSVMNDLEKVVGDLGSSTTDTDWYQSRESLNNLMTQMQSMISKPSISGDSLEPGSRADTIQNHLLSIKSLLATESTRIGKPDGDADKIKNLYCRIAKLNTYVHNTQGDEKKLADLEYDQVRQLVCEVRAYLRRQQITLVNPNWASRITTTNCNFAYFSGVKTTRKVVVDALTSIGIQTSRPEYPGNETSEGHWNDLCSANLAIFDLSYENPQNVNYNLHEVYYHLGIALTLGKQLLLFAKSGTEIKFNVAQEIVSFSSASDLKTNIGSILLDTLYQLQSKGNYDSSVSNTYQYLKDLAKEIKSDTSLNFNLGKLNKLQSDPIPFRAALEFCLNSIPQNQHMAIYPRWPGVYENTDHPSCFVVMPFRKDLDNTWEAIKNECGKENIFPVRGDFAEGKEIIQSIWKEIGQAKYIIVDLTGFNLNVCLELGIANTLGKNVLQISQFKWGDKEHNDGFPIPGSIKTNRYADYGEHPKNNKRFLNTLSAFLGGTS